METKPIESVEGSPEARRYEFRLLEHRWLQEKERQASEDLYRTETLVPIAIGLIYAWLYGGEDGPRNVPPGLWWVPVLIAGFGAWRQRLRYRTLWGYHFYMRAIEREAYGDPPEPYPPGAEAPPEALRPFGWQGYWVRRVSPPEQRRPWRGSSHGNMRKLFWLLLLAGTFAIAYGHTVLQPDSVPVPSK
jgi:hypothetical protein